jgi:protein-S-isoprenylcysteine O-methyltransferase Ste14
MFLAGCAAFLFFFASDCNDRWLHNRALTLSFPAGAVLLVTAIIAQTVRGAPPIDSLLVRGFFWILAVLFAALLGFTLFFALPLQGSYAAPGTHRPVYDAGVYALCRHPGVLWQAGLCLCLWLAAGFPTHALLSYTALNIALVSFEDYCVFPEILRGYGEYKKNTPFLIPTPKSVRRCLKHYRFSKSERRENRG